MKYENNGKKGVFKLCLLLVGSMIGAGFITGVEIWQFFARFGWSCWFGVAVFGALSFLLVYNELIRKSKAEKSFSRFDRAKRKIDFFSEVMVASAMISGLKIIAKQLFNHNQIFVILLFIIVIFIILYKGFEMFSLYNYFVVGFALVVGVILLLLNKNYNFEHIESVNAQKGLFSMGFACFYIFMNISTIKPIISNYDANFNKKSAVKLSLIFACFMLILILIFVIFLQNNLYLTKSEMPLFELFSTKTKFKIIFSFGVVCCMVSTCLACLFGVKREVTNKTHDNFFATIFSLILILILSFIPFSFFVSAIYVVIGILNLILFSCELLTKQ